MTGDDITNALKRVCRHCDELMDGYVPISMRKSLKYLGYNRVEQDEVIRYCAMNGFDYCLDPIIAASHFDPNNKDAVNGMVTDAPAAWACEWGPDQLKSRVMSVRPPR
jgi:hypothetical protein